MAAACFVGTAVAARDSAADGVGDQQQKVQQIADQLDAIANQVSQLGDDYDSALDQKAGLDAEIVDSQVKVDAQRAQLNVLQAQLAEIAISKYTSGSDAAFSPVFSDAAAYSDAQQRIELNRLSIDNGAGDVDQAAALADDLAKETAILDGKQKQAATLVATLDSKKSEAVKLEASYQSEYAAAKAELGDLLEVERQRREAAAAAAAVASSKAAQESAAAAFRAKAAAAAAQPQAPAAAPVTPHPSSAAPAAPAAPAAAPANVAAPPRGGGSIPVSEPAGPAAPPAPPPPSSRAGGAVAAAMAQLGVPYVFAAASPGVAFDCSGLTKYAWGTVGVSLPHFAASQFSISPHVSQADIQPGDLIFYYEPIGHVGMYVGNGQLIHAPRTGDVVKISTVNWGKVVGISRPG